MPKVLSGDLDDIQIKVELSSVGSSDRNILQLIRALPDIGAKLTHETEA